MAYISNLLTHWVGSKMATDEERYDVLVEKIIKNKRLLYSHNTIPFGSKYGGINKGAWGLSMVCFTDIPFSETEEHCKKYSSFGVSFSKSHLVNSCVVPVWYTLSPFVYEAYSYMFHSIIGLKPLIDGKIIPEGNKKGELFRIHNYMQKLHNFVALGQDYSENEFKFIEGTLEVNDQQKQFFNETDSYYYEREWRSIYRHGDSFVWNEDDGENHYFKFSEESVKHVIVPRKLMDRLKQDINKYFMQKNIPNVTAYEDLKYL